MIYMDLWPDFNISEPATNNAIEILREQACLLEKKTNKKVKAIFSTISRYTPEVENVVEKTRQALINNCQHLEAELQDKIDANKLYSFTNYKFEIYNDTYRFRVFVLENRMMFPIFIQPDEGIATELGYGNQVTIYSNDDLPKIISNIFSSQKLQNIIYKMKS